jgi:hypothetical protein
VALISGVTGQGLKELLERLWVLLKEQNPPS